MSATATLTIRKAPDEEEPCSNCIFTVNRYTMKLTVEGSDGHDTDFYICDQCLLRNVTKACGPDRYAESVLTVRTPA